MAKRGGKKSFNASLFRRRREAANDRRFCIVWINRMVNKKVEKQIAELHSKILFLFHALREEMVAEIQAQLRELTLEEAGERHLIYARLNREQGGTSSWPMKMEKEHEEKSEEHENHAANSPDLDTSSFSVTSSEMLPIISDVFSNGGSSCSDTSHSNTSVVFQDADTSSQPAKSDVDTVADTSQVKESEKKESSTNPFYANLSFITKEQRCEEDSVQVDRIKEDKALLMDRQWKEWMDEQERRENQKVQPADQQKTEKQEGAAPPLSQKKMKQNVKEVNILAKMRTRFSGLFNPLAPYERLEDED